MSRARSRRKRARTTPEYAASALPGLERVVSQELNDKLEATALDTRRGWVVFSYSGDVGDLLMLSTTEDVFVVLYRTAELPVSRKDALSLLTRMARGSRYWDPAWTQFRQTRRAVRRVTFRVIAQMAGKHPFRRQEARDAVLAGIHARWPGWKPVADDAHAEIWVSVVDRWATIAIRLSDRTMRHRTYKVEHRPASLRPTLAAAMVTLSRPRPGDRFCDPMCGAGTILAERARYGPFRELLGGDMDTGALRAARANLAQVREARGRHVVHLWDARALPVRSEWLDAVVSNLPFGEQVGSHAANLSLYQSFWGQLLRTLNHGGRAVLLTSEKELMRDLLREHRQLEREQEILVGVLGQAARVYVLRKR